MARPVKAEKIKKPMRKAAAIAVVSISLGAGALGGYLAGNPEKVGTNTGRAKPASIFASKKPTAEPAVGQASQKETGKKEEKAGSLNEKRSIMSGGETREVRTMGDRTIQESREETGKCRKKRRRLGKGRMNQKRISDEKLMAQMRDPMLKKQPEISCSEAYESIAVMRALRAGHVEEVREYFARKKARKKRIKEREKAKKEMARMKKRAERNRVEIKPHGPAPKRPEVRPQMAEPHVPVERGKYPRRRDVEKCVNSKIKCSPF
ncbi:hypothetical protein GF415_00105 [Candidatus Micrarchaeota archaeon]|nr:hypothetical protein [Candidatus Micrarchaeota archaeon]